MTKWILVLVSALSVNAFATDSEKTPTRKPASNFFESLELLREFSEQAKKAKSCVAWIGKKTEEKQTQVLPFVSCDGVTLPFPMDLQNSAGQSFSFFDTQSGFMAWFGKEKFRFVSAVGSQDHSVFLYFTK